MRKPKLLTKIKGELRGRHWDRQTDRQTVGQSNCEAAKGAGQKNYRAKTAEQHENLLEAANRIGHSIRKTQAQAEAETERPESEAESESETESSR